MTQSMRIPLILAAGALVSLGTWLAGRRHPSPALRAHAPGERVTWIGTAAATGPSAAPLAEEALVIRDAVVRARLSTYGAITRRVAEELFRRDHVRGGWASDIGLFSRWYVRHAAEALDRLDGTLVRIDPERPGAGPWR